MVLLVNYKGSYLLEGMVVLAVVQTLLIRLVRMVVMGHYYKVIMEEKGQEVWVYFMLAVVVAVLIVLVLTLYSMQKLVALAVLEFQVVLMELLLIMEVAVVVAPHLTLVGPRIVEG
jgi:hypothetical protein